MGAALAAQQHDHTSSVGSMRSCNTGSTAARTTVVAGGRDQERWPQQANRRYNQHQQPGSTCCRHPCSGALAFRAQGAGDCVHFLLGAQPLGPAGLQAARRLARPPPLLPSAAHCAHCRPSHAWAVAPKLPCTIPRHPAACPPLSLSPRHATTCTLTHAPGPPPQTPPGYEKRWTLFSSFWYLVMQFKYFSVPPAVRYVFFLGWRAVMFQVYEAHKALVLWRESGSGRVESLKHWKV